MKYAVRCILAGQLIVAAPAMAHAGLRDQLNEATKKLNEKSQQLQQNSTAGSSGGNFGGSLSAGLGATKLDGLSNYNNCMAPLNGLNEKLHAEILQRKLAADTLTPPAAQRVGRGYRRLAGGGAGRGG